MNGLAYTMRERRTTIQGALTYKQGEMAGKAQWMDASRTGAQVRMDRYIVPGRIIRLAFAAGKGAEAVEMDARVVWCRRLPGTQEFAAGLMVRRNEPEAAVAFAALRHGAHASNETVSQQVRRPRWAALDAAGESGNGVAARGTLQHAI